MKNHMIIPPNRILVVALTVLSGAASAAAADLKPAFDFAEVGPEEYRPLRRELRAFHPAECHDKCKSSEVLASHEKMRAEVRAYAAAHPDFDALDLRREYYGALVRNFRPVLFGESPFYFESGVNGGWAERHNPARIVQQLCGKFYKSQSLVPQEAFDRMRERHRQRYSLCCGPFVDNMHHLPPFHTIFAKGFRGVREDVAAAIRTCPADDPHGKKELETALVGLDAIHEIQLAFAREAKRRLSELTAATSNASPNRRRAVRGSRRGISSRDSTRSGSCARSWRSRTRRTTSPSVARTPGSSTSTATTSSRVFSPRRRRATSCGAS